MACNSPGPEGQETTAGSTDPVDAVTEPLGRSAAVGTLWLTGQRWIVRVSGFVTIAVLTRLIAPADFGVVAAASTITPMVLLLADLGLSTYIVQAEDVDSRILSTGFWFSVTAGTVLAVGLALLAPLIADAFNIEGSAAVLRAMSLSVLITVVSSVPIALMRRRMLFRLLAIQGAAAAIASQTVAVVVALAGGGAWALVAQLLVGQAVIGTLAWRSAGWVPRREFSARLFASMAQFGIKVVAVEIVATIRATLEAAIISNALGAAALGYLSIAERLVTTAQDVGATALVPVSMVVFAKIRDSRERLRAGYLRALRIGYAAVSPILTFVAVGAPLIIPLVFGIGWEPAIPVVQALAVAAILVLGAMIDHGLHYGVGAPGRWFAYALGIDVLTVASTAVLAPRGLTWVAVGFVAVALVATIARWLLVGRLVGCPPWVLAGGFMVAMVPVVASAGAGIAVRVTANGLPALLAVTIVCATVVIVHLVVVRLVSRRVLAETLDLLPIPQRFAGIRRLV